jgi:hypothetical protein
MAADGSVSDVQARIHAELVKWADRRGVIVEAAPGRAEQLLTVNLADGQTSPQILAIGWSAFTDRVELLMLALPGSPRSQRWARRHTSVNHLAAALDTMWQKRASSLAARRTIG